MSIFSLTRVCLSVCLSVCACVSVCLCVSVRGERERAIDSELEYFIDVVVGNHRVSSHNSPFDNSGILLELKRYLFFVASERTRSKRQLELTVRKLVNVR